MSDGLDQLRRRVAAEHGIARWWDELSGGNEAQMHESAERIRDKIGASPTGSASPPSNANAAGCSGVIGYARPSGTSLLHGRP